MYILNSSSGSIFKESNDINRMTTQDNKEIFENFNEVNYKSYTILLSKINDIKILAYHYKSEKNKKLTGDAISVSRTLFNLNETFTENEILKNMKLINEEYPELFL